MQSRPAYALIGLFVVLLGGAVFATVVWLGATAGDADRRLYVAYVEESVAGLNVKSAVRYHGVDVGRVRAIGLEPGNPERVRLLLAIEEGTPIREDTVATLATQGITGLAYVELTGGSPGSPPLTAGPDEPYPEIETKPSLFGRIDQVAPRLLEQVDQTTRQLAEMTERISDIFSPRNQAAVTSILADLQRISALLGGRVETLDRGIDQLGKLFERSSEAVDRLPGLVSRAQDGMALLEETSADVSETARAFTRLAERIDRLATDVHKGPMQDIDRLAEMTEREIAVFSGVTQPELLRVLEELRKTAVTLRRVAEDLERDPSAVLFGRRDIPPGPGEEASE